MIWFPFTTVTFVAIIYIHVVQADNYDTSTQPIIKAVSYADLPGKYYLAYNDFSFFSKTLQVGGGAVVILLIIGVLSFLKWKNESGKKLVDVKPPAETYYNDL